MVKRVIAFVLDDSLDKSDGVQQYILTLGTWLSGQGHTVHYLVGESSRNDVTNVHSLAKNVNVRFNQNRMSIPLPASRKKIRHTLNSIQPDVLHVQMPYNPFLAARIIKAAAPTTAVVGTFHILPFSFLESVATRGLGVWLSSTLKRFDQIVSVSDPAALFAKKTFGVRSITIPNTVATTSMQLQVAHTSPKGIVSLVFLGRLVSRKGCMALLKALAVLQKDKDVPPYHLTICGKGPQELKLKQFAAAHGLTPHVTFAGFVSEEEKAGYLAGATLAIFPSLGGESFGIVLIEAMAAGAEVVVGGNNPGYASVLEDTRVLVSPQKSAKFALQLKSLLTDAPLRGELHKKQVLQVSKYDINTVGAQITAVYEAAIAKRKKDTHNNGNV